MTPNGMRAQTILIDDRLSGRMTERRAYVSDEWPGLAVHRTIHQPGWWNVTHIESGKTPGIQWCVRTRAKAAKVAAALSAVVDWTRPSKSLLRDSHAHAAAKAVQQALVDGTLFSKEAP